MHSEISYRKEKREISFKSESNENERKIKSKEIKKNVTLLEIFLHSMHFSFRVSSVVRAQKKNINK